MSGDFVIRPAVPADGAAIRDVHVASILGLGPGHYTRAELESWAAGLDPDRYGEAMTVEGELFEVACTADGRIVAFCSRRDDEVCALYIHPDAARRGLGGTLLRRAEAAIAAAGHRTIRIGASLSGRPLYERHGYRTVAEKDWITRGGLVVRAFDMEKTLPGK